MRGDGPTLELLLAWAEPFSPRAWGWSDSMISRSFKSSVLPTCVGMVRDMLGLRVSDWGSPHVRGDGPKHGGPRCSASTFSPRAWGWSDQGRDNSAHGQVLPTCVGMVRWHSIASAKTIGSPHVRGDGPALMWRTCYSRTFSPRAWGWSVVRPTAQGSGRVLPTCVGMVRAAPGAWCFARSSPHVRGDGPDSPSINELTARFSPRAWGWSVEPRSMSNCRQVLPTCVGMVRDGRHRTCCRARSPHVRGDGPNITALSGN